MDAYCENERWAETWATSDPAPRTPPPSRLVWPPEWQVCRSDWPEDWYEELCDE